MDADDKRTAKRRTEFEKWMQGMYAGFQLDRYETSGCYVDPAVNCAWDIWQLFTKVKRRWQNCA